MSLEWGGVVIVTTMLAKWARMLTVAWQHSRLLRDAPALKVQM